MAPVLLSQSLTSQEFPIKLFSFSNPHDPFPFLCHFLEYQCCFCVVVLPVFIQEHAQNHAI